MKRILLSLIIISLFLPVYAKSEEAGASEGSGSKKSTGYPIKVTIKTVKNRTMEASVRNHKVIVDQPKDFGADDLGPTPPEMLVISYGSCIASTIQFLAYQQKINITDIVVNIEGTVDFAKAMGISEKNRAGIPLLTAEISFKSSLSKEEKEIFIKKVFEVGAAIDNIVNATPVKYKIVN
ncbi:MAG TPA: OsmC family protein [bacterium]|nr:OsmC family protein [bacterium]HPS31488.1 OsmC family protein [bacterium]